MRLYHKTSFFILHWHHEGWNDPPLNIEDFDWFICLSKELDIFDVIHSEFQRDPKKKNKQKKKTIGINLYNI